MGYISLPSVTHVEPGTTAFIDGDGVFVIVIRGTPVAFCQRQLLLYADCGNSVCVGDLALLAREVVALTRQGFAFDFMGCVKKYLRCTMVTDKAISYLRWKQFLLLMIKF